MQLEGTRPETIEADTTFLGAPLTTALLVPPQVIKYRGSRDKMRAAAAQLQENITVYEKTLEQIKKQSALAAKRKAALPTASGKDGAGKDDFPGPFKFSYSQLSKRGLFVGLPTLPDLSEKKTARLLHRCAPRTEGPPPFATALCAPSLRLCHPATVRAPTPPHRVVACVRAQGDVRTGAHRAGRVRGAGTVQAWRRRAGATAQPPRPTLNTRGRLRSLRTKT